MAGVMMTETLYDLSLQLFHYEDLKKCDYMYEFHTMIQIMISSRCLNALDQGRVDAGSMCGSQCRKAQQEGSGGG